MPTFSGLDTAISELSERERIRKAEEEADRRDDLDKIRAAQDLLFILGHRAAAPKRTRSVLRAGSDAMDIRSNHLIKRRRCY